VALVRVRPAPARSRAPSAQLHHPVIVAVGSVRVVEVAGDEIVDMVAMRNRGVAAGLSVAVVSRVARARVGRRAGARIDAADGQRMLVDVIFVRVVEVSTMCVVGVPVVLDGRMPTLRSVGVGMSLVDLMARHRRFSFRGSIALLVGKA